MTAIDQLAAVKASLELAIEENDELLDHFSGVIEKLEVIEKLPPGIKSVQFKQLEQSGAFKFKGADIRYFAKHNKESLTPPQFVERTRRRLHNTSALNDAFFQYAEFEGGSQLKTAIESLTVTIFDYNDQKAVVDFKDRVENLRESALFKKYIEIKNSYIKKNPDLKDEAEFLSAKVSVEDARMLAQNHGKELTEIQEDLENGEITSEEAQKNLDKFNIPNEDLEELAEVFDSSESTLE